MSTDIMLGSGGDILISNRGDIQTIRDEDELIQMAINNLKTVYGEYFADPERGNMAFQRRMKMTTNALNSMEHDCRVAILHDIRIIEVPSIVITRTGIYECTIDFTIKDRNNRILNSTTRLSA